MHVAELFNIRGKVALVTGGSMGLGEQMARALAEAGANVAVSARNLERCEATAGAIQKECDVKTMAVQCNVAEENQVRKMVEDVMSRFGRIDILVNNAGTTWGAPALDYPARGWDKVMDVNVKGTFLCCQYAGREMVRQGNGKIINIASVAGLMGSAPEKMDAVAYTTSKGAVIMLTRDLAAKWARHNINVNAIAPGWFPTDMTAWTIETRGDILTRDVPMKRYGKDYELKGAALFLASEASSYVTGHTLFVDGGEVIV